MSRLAPSFIKRKGETATWRSRVLGSRDSVTGHPAITWISGLCFDCDCFDPDCFLCDYNIEIIKSKISTREVEVAGTRMTRKHIRFFTWAPIKKYDQIYYHGETYEVESVETHYYLNGARSYQDAEMVERSFEGAP